jgi:hypothetical protein
MKTARKTNATRALNFRGYTKEDGHFEFTVSGQEWIAECPKIRGCHDLPKLDYQVRAAYKKAATITPHRVLALQLM